MTLTPLDIDNLQFKVGFRGYIREEVEQFLAEASRTLEEYINEAGRLKARIAELERDVARYRESEEVVKNSMVLAQRTCDELIAAAHQRADAIRHQAEAEGEETRRQFSDLQVQREQFEYAFYGLLTGFIQRLEQSNPALGRHAAPPAAAAAPPARPTTVQPPSAGPAAAPAPPASPGSTPPSLPWIVPKLDPPRPAGPAPLTPAGAPPPAPPPGAGDQTLTGRDQDMASFLSALERTGDPPADPPATGG